jgi:hypothetical protein
MALLSASTQKKAGSARKAPPAQRLVCAEVTTDKGDIYFKSTIFRVWTKSPVVRRYRYIPEE